jgi:hypothetical protein
MHRLRATPFDYAKLLAPSGGAFDEQREAAPSCFDRRQAPEAPNTRFFDDTTSRFLIRIVSWQCRGPLAAGRSPKYGSWSPTSAPS